MPRMKVPTLGDLPPEAREAFEKMISQIPIVMARRAGGTLRVKVSEIDECGPFILDFAVDGAEFVFKVRRKD
jgi:hypothetical protein